MAWKKSKKCSTSPSKHDTCCAPSIPSATCNATLKNVFVAVAEVVLHRARQSEQLATICAEKAWRTSLLARGVGGRSDLQRNQRTLGENCFAGRAGGVLHYATQIAAIDSTCATLRATKTDALQVCKLPRYHVTQRNSSATCNAAVLRGETGPLAAVPALVLGRPTTNRKVGWNYSSATTTYSQNSLFHDSPLEICSLHY